MRLQWRGDNYREFMDALAAFEIMVSPDGDKLHLATAGKSIAPLELGDEIEVHQDGVKIHRPPEPDRKVERWMTWRGDNFQEVLDFIEPTGWRIGLKTVGPALYLKGYRGQKTPTILHPGDSIIENKDGLWFRRKDTRQ